MGAHEIDQTFGAGASEALRGETGGRFDARRQSVVAKTQKLLIEFRDSDVEAAGSSGPPEEITPSSRRAVAHGAAEGGQ